MSASAAALRFSGPAALLAGVVGGEADAWAADLGAVVVSCDERPAASATPTSVALDASLWGDVGEAQESLADRLRRARGWRSRGPSPADSRVFEPCGVLHQMQLRPVLLGSACRTGRHSRSVRRWTGAVPACPRRRSRSTAATGGCRSGRRAARRGPGRDRSPAGRARRAGCCGRALAGADAVGGGQEGNGHRRQRGAVASDDSGGGRGAAGGQLPPDREQAAQVGQGGLGAAGCGCLSRRGRARHPARRVRARHPDGPVPNLSGCSPRSTTGTVP